MSTKRKPSNVPSLLLNESENEQLFNILGRACLTLASGVCQLYTAEPDDTSQQRWCKRMTGVVCFVKDNLKRSHFIRLFDIKNGALIWEQEIYMQFKYKTPRQYFHTFEADSVQAGLNFASEDEAAKFKSAVERKLMEMHQRRLERRKKRLATSQNQNVVQVVNTSPQANVQVSLGINSAMGNTDTNLTMGFDINNLDSGIKTLFEQIGITNMANIDKDTADFVCGFVQQHGGIDKIQEMMKNKPHPSGPRGKHVTVVNVTKGGGPPQRGPTPSRQMGGPPSSGAPPAPPPPGVRHAAPRPQATSVESPGMPSGAGRGALLDSIRGGMQLKPPGESPKVERHEQGALLASIKGGIQLKQLVEAPKAILDSADEDGIVGALAMALDYRNKILQDSDDDDDDNISDYEEWD